MSKIAYFLRETFINLRRNLFMTAASISIVTVSLLLLGGVVVFGNIMGRIIGVWESRVEVNVYLREEITPEQNEELEAALSGMPEVENILFVSKAEAYEEFKGWYEDAPQTVENVDPDALPASYRVKLEDPSKVDAVRTRIDGRPGVDQVIDGGDLVRNLLRFNAVVRAVVLGLTILFLVAATLLIANTIRLAIYARRREIGIMKLVGGTNWFIRMPFVFEGMLEGMLGALLASLAIVGGKEFGLDRAQEFLVFLPITVGYDEVLQTFLILVTVGMFIGALGSVMALRRFLDV